MYYSYFKLAIRNLIKYKLYALINLLGLSLGLILFLFGTLLVDYEQNHDGMFSNRDRIFTVGSIFSPNAGTGIKEYPNVRTAYGPIFDAEITDAEVVARSLGRLKLFSINNEHFYQNVRFVDPGFTQIFDFNYLYGEAGFELQPNAIALTASTAQKLFGRIDVVGEVLTLDHKLDLHVAAVFEDIAPDSHFNSSALPDSQLSIIASIQALINLDEFEFEGSWQGLNPYEMTYLLLPKDRGAQWLLGQVNNISERHAPEDEKEDISALKVSPLIDQNTQIWDAFGFPVLMSVQVLGILILVIACLNYTNLATAQSFGRSKEVGLRKTFGASRSQLLVQFLIESIILSVFAMLIALASIEILLPLYNSFTGKGVNLHYLSILPTLCGITLGVGLLAGGYPAYLISRSNPIDSLKNSLVKGKKGSLFRSVMISAQFAISIFMLAMVLIINFQNNKMKDLSSRFLNAPTVVLSGLNKPGIAEKFTTLKQELLNIAGAEQVTFSNAVPYSASGYGQNVSAVQGDESQDFRMTLESIDYDYISTYEIDLIAGRAFDQLISGDFFKDEVEQVNVIVNALLVEKLGLEDAASAIGKSFFKITDAELSPDRREYQIIGVMKNEYFYGTHSDIRPMAFQVDPTVFSYASIRLNPANANESLNDIENVWREIVDDYPMQRQFLDFYFNLFFRFPEGINNVLGGFATVALSLALFGLFGLAAFLAQRRTKEIGIRKVMGASITQIVGLLIWQFSKPVLWSLAIAIPLAYFASSTYLNFFPERVDFIAPVIAIACIIGLATAWAIVSIHAVRIAKATPIKSLRYE